MIHHIVLWNLKDELSQQEKIEAAANIKEKLEAVKNEAEGVIDLRVVINELPSSNMDIGLISAFESEKALNAYQEHPAHKLAGEYVKSVACNRKCFDYCTEQ